MKHFRINLSDGTILGVADMALEEALLNINRGEALAPYDPDIEPRTHRWTPTGWEILPPTPDKVDDWAFMRNTGYPPVGDQLGAIMKLLADPSDQAARAEFEAVLATIQSVKATYPKDGSAAVELPKPA